MLIPIVFGITGHRDLRPEDIPELKEKIKSIFINVRNELSGSLKIYKTYSKILPFSNKKRALNQQSGQTPFILISPLAEGADLLAAKAALELGWIDLVVPLPMPKDEYVKDFTTLESRNEFEDLLKKAKISFELPLPDMGRDENEPVMPEISLRDRQYDQVGAYVARHSQILIALWDGLEKENSFGTSRTVKYKLEGDAKSLNNLLEPVDRGPVYHILTPRRSHTKKLENALRLNIIYPEEHSDWGKRHEKYFREQRKADVFNKDVVKILSKPRMQALVEQNKSYLIDHKDFTALKKNPEYKKAISGIEDLSNYYAAADTLSIYFSTRRRISIIVLSVLTMIAVLAFVIYKNSDNVYLLMFYPGSIFIAYLVYFLVDRYNFQDKHQDYRALAEGLRVQFFWKVAGIQEDVSDYYLKKHKSYLEWIRNAIRAWNIPKGDERVLKPDLNIVKRCWIKSESDKSGQMDYFNIKARFYKKRNKTYGNIAKGINIIVFAFAVIVLILSLIPGFNENFRNYIRLLIFLTAFFPPFTKVLTTYTEKMSYKELPPIYERMEELFRIALVKIDGFLKKNDIENAKQIIFELGKEVLNENGDWIMMNRDKVMDKPIK